ncbi:hypothetical protein OXB_0133 [Bacillus sp. OxB-1]|nr:hypothetical protein OXB_0133 [Bacillus sp. OxB-1]
MFTIKIPSKAKPRKPSKTSIRFIRYPPISLDSYRIQVEDKGSITENLILSLELKGMIKEKGKMQNGERNNFNCR